MHAQHVVDWQVALVGIVIIILSTHWRPVVEAAVGCSVFNKNNKHFVVSNKNILLELYVHAACFRLHMPPLGRPSSCDAVGG